jgi:uncharacterized membrane protein HdeD (DUF308 family)
MSNIHVEPRLGLAGRALLRTLAENWWLLLLRGVAAIAFGVIAFFWPGITLLALTYLFGAYALADGIFGLWAAIASESGDTASRWWLAIGGVVSILASAVAFFWPGMTALVLLIFIATWAIIIGALELYGAFQLRKVIANEWWLVLSGLISIAFGILLLARPGTGALALIWTIAGYAVFFGCLFVILAFRLRNYKQS